jgi:predicted ATPase/DNA-binding CsgD family transcriptional regulator
MTMSVSENQTNSRRGPMANLPVVRTSFIGRQRELEEAEGLLAAERLVTLIGPAGCGKTRLALRLAHRLGQRQEAGVYWMELAPLADQALLAQTVARALGVRERPGEPVLETVLQALQDRRPLLVLDNCEHLLPACAGLAEQLLAHTGVRLIATSRQPLGVHGERLFPVEPLPAPPAAATVEELARFDAVRLFVVRAQAILPDFELTGENAAQVAAICRSLDGIPLALELASARVKVLTVDQIAARLDDHLALVPPAPPMVYSYHATLRAAIDWSYALLGPGEQTLLRRLAVFSGGWSLSAAETVCAGDDIAREQVLDLLTSLVERSLVAAETRRPGEARYRMLETVRQYAQEKLRAAGEWAELRDRHLDHFVRRTEEADRKLRGREQQLWLDGLETEYDNIRAALKWSLESGRIESGLRIGAALYQFWVIRDYVDEGSSWLEQLVANADDAVAVTPRVNGLAYATLLAGIRGRTAAQVAYGREAVAVAREAGERARPALAMALSAQGFGARAQGDYQTELGLAQEIIQLRRELGDPYMLGLALSLYAPTAMAAGEYGIAQEMLDEAMPLLRQSGDPYRIAMALNYTGDLARCLGDYAPARQAYEESMAMLREVDAERDLASVMHNLGHSLLHLGQVEPARALFEQSLASHQVPQNREGLAECLIGFAALAILDDQLAEGARLLAAATAHARQHVTSRWAATRLEHEHYVELARSGLGETQFQAAQEAGQNLSLEQAVAEAQALAQRAAAARRLRSQLEELTPREREVATLVARARSNDEIAAELVLSKRTVESHISSLYAKLGFEQRAQIVRWALDSGLIDGSDRNSD